MKNSIYILHRLFFLIALIIFSSPLIAQWENAVLDTITADLSQDIVNNKQAIDVDENDNVHLIWTKIIDNGFQIMYNRRNPDGIWGGSIAIDQGVGSAFNPSTTLLPGVGRPVATYVVGNPPSQEVAVSYFTSNNWTTVYLNNGGNEKYSPSIAADNNGFLHIAWVGANNDGDYKIFYCRFTLATDTFVIQELEESSPGDFGSGADPYIVWSETTGVIIGYRGGDFNNYNIHLANKTPGSDMWEFETIDTPNADDYTNAITIKNDVIHLLVSGNDGFGIGGAGYYLRKQFGEPWSTPDKVNISGNAVIGSSLVIDDNGKAHCVWEELSGNFLLGNIHYSTNKNGDWQSVPLLMNGATHNANLAFNTKGQGILMGEMEDIQSFDADLIEVIVFGAPEVISSVQNLPIQNESISIFPNPADTEINIQQADNQPIDKQFSLFDLDGKLLFKQSLSGEDRLRLDRTQLLPGMYFYTLDEGDQVVKTGKIILE